MTGSVPGDDEVVGTVSVGSSRPACFAPFTSLYLTPRGDVQACCFNVTRPLGNITTERLTDIWRGAAADRLRAALDADDLGHGCQVCAWELDDGLEPPSRDFDDFPAPGPPAWPRRLELALSNRCNLACVMCHGELSSTIRARRERLPALPSVYDDRFFADLDELLPHLDQIKLLGGEPMLAPETVRVLEALIRLDAPAACHLTTNGTRIGPVMEDLMARRPLHFSISIDGSSREVVEDVRRGIDHERMLAGFHRLRRYCADAGTTLAVCFTLMRRNWHELADVVLLAEEHGLRALVNPVAYPYGESLASCTPDELDEVARGLADRDRAVRAALVVNEPAWDGVLARVDALRRRAAGRERPHRTLRVRSAGTAAASPPDRAGDGDRLRCDSSETVLAVDGAGFLGVPAEACVGRPALLAVHRAESRLGADARVVSEDTGTATVHRLSFVSRAGTTVAVARLVVEPEEGGGTTWRAWWEDPPAA